MAATVTAKGIRRTRSDGERTRRKILETAVRLATVQGLDGLSIGNLALATEVSKSGLYAHFGSKEELQLETIEVARDLFIEVVVVPALGVEGRGRVVGLCDSFLDYVLRRILPGGCFFAAVAAEQGARPGPVRSRVAEIQLEWMNLLVESVSKAVEAGEFSLDTDVELLAFELNAVVVAANTAFNLHDNPAVVERARAAVERIVGSVEPG